MKSILLALSITQQPEPFSLDESDAGLALSDIVRDSLRMQRFEFSDPLDFSFLLRSENEAAVFAAVRYYGSSCLIYLEVVYPKHISRLSASREQSIRLVRQRYRKASPRNVRVRQDILPELPKRETNLGGRFVLTRLIQAETTQTGIRQKL